MALLADTDFFFFSRRGRHRRCLSDWSSDVCSPDLFLLRLRRGLIACSQAVFLSAANQINATICRQPFTIIMACNTGPRRNSMKLPSIALSLLMFATLILMAGCAAPPTAVTFTTPYQAVLLSNNSVYYGKLAGFGTASPVLTDIFYIVTQTDPNTKETKNMLVKRGKELHGPDRMYLNATSIVFVEPVGADSKVAQLIDEAAKKQ